MDKKLAVARKNDRRNIPRTKDGFYRFVVGINFLGWGVLVAALIIFHFARPDFVTGLQAYWGVDGSEQWSQRYVNALILLLQACLTLSLVTMLLRAWRNRREKDNFGINLFILAGISIISLFTLLVTVA